jgi:hypothetical protein
MTAFWPCRVCETSNRTGVATCDVCEADRPLAAAVVASARAAWARGLAALPPPADATSARSSSPAILPLRRSSPTTAPHAPAPSAPVPRAVAPIGVARRMTEAPPTWAIALANTRLRVLRALHAVSLALERLLRG